MLQDIHTWMQGFQGSGFLLIAVLLCCALMILWNDIRRLKNITNQMYGHTQRLSNELAQQRYALATLRQAITTPEGQPAVNEQNLLNEAIHQLDQVLQTLPDKQKNTTDPQDIDQLKERDILAFVRKALKENNIALAIQPIKTMPYRHTRFYEVFSRVKLGNHYLPAGKFLSIAKDHGLMATIDQSFLLKTLELIQKKANDDVSISYFCNLSAECFSNKNLMAAIIQFLSSQPRLSSRLIFELTQDDTFRLGPQAKQICEKLAELGCRFSMDNVKMMVLDVVRLRELHVSFVKFNVNTVLKEVEDHAGKRRWGRLTNLMAGQGIEIVIEKIENGKQLDKLKDTGFDYAQGYHLGEPEIVS